MPTAADTHPFFSIGSASTRTGRRRAFSLIELLVVISIIAIVIAITVPAIGAARDLARRSAAESQMQSLTTAVSSFQADENRAPGYFSARDMAEAETGFTGMQNVLLDLSGGPIAEATAPMGALEIGPDEMDNTVFVNPALVGVDGGGQQTYLSPGANDLQAAEGKIATGGADNNGINGNDNLEFFEIIDPWGNPIIAHQEDEFAPGMGSLADPMLENFAADKGATTPARFYIGQNQSVLLSTTLGARGEDQTQGLLANTDRSAALNAFAAVVGQPASPVRMGGGDNANAPVQELLPSTSRGTVIFHSAGRDRVFLSQGDRGLRELGGMLTFWKNFSPSATGNFGNQASLWPDADGQTGTIDAAGKFNDIIVGAR